MSKPLPHYLRTFRRKSGLSQAEVAFLLGSESGSRVSRYERFHRMPGLEIAIAYAVVFQAPMSELFAGLHDQVADGIRDRAQVLRRRICATADTGFRSRKLLSIQSILRSREEDALRP